MTSTILLDPDIRNWVLFPIFIIVLLVGVLRHYVSILMQNPKNESLSDKCNSNITQSASILLQEKNALPTSSFLSRAQLMIDKTLKKVPEKRDVGDVFDPSVTTGMMKGQLMMMANNIGLMMLISSFFSGFVVAQLPFSIPLRLKDMMQRGINIDDLECSYVTSISFYFLVLSGVNGLLNLLLGADEEVKAVVSNSMVEMQNVNFTQPPDLAKVWAQQTKDLKYACTRHSWSFEASPMKLLSVWEEEGH